MPHIRRVACTAPAAAYAIAPSGKRLAVSILDNKDGTVSLYFQPAEKGMHELHVLQAGVPITGSPIDAP